jgi:hypothetical protein
MVKLFQEYSDMLECLENMGARYVVVGAFAMAHFGYIRATGDIDIFVEPTATNSTLVIAALKAFGAPLFGVQDDYFASPGNFLQIGVPPSRIDLITKIDGVDFGEAFESVERGHIVGRSIPVIGLDLLIRNKESTGREKDRPDVQELRKIRAALGK